MQDLRDNSSNSDKYTNDRFVSDCATRHQPAETNDCTCLDVANDCTRNRTSLRDNEKLGHVNNAGEQARLESGQPNFVMHTRDLVPREQHNTSWLTIIIITHLFTGNSVHVGKVSTNGIT